MPKSPLCRVAHVEFRIIAEIAAIVNQKSPKPVSRRKSLYGVSTHAQVLGHNLASGGCQPTELHAFDSEGLRRSARRVCGDRGRHSPDCESCDYAI